MNPVKCSACVVSQKIAIEWGVAILGNMPFWTLTKEIIDIPVNLQQGTIKDLC